MKRLRISFVRRFLRDQRGQSAVVIVVSLLAVMALSAAGIESGHVYLAYRQLVASTQAATLAGAQDMPNITQARSDVIKYSVESGQENYTSQLTWTSITPTFTCGSVATSLNVTCQTPTAGSCSSGSTCNTLTVVQDATVNLWFGGIIGIKTFSLSASATAAMRGGTATPYNIAVVMDTTNSMTASAPAADGCGSGATQIQCAVSGLRIMLGIMDPCALNTTCSSTTPYVDGVALFVFPAVAYSASNTNIKDDTVCNTTNPAIAAYTFNNVSSSNISNKSPGSSTNLIMPSTTGTYEVTNLSGSGVTGTSGEDANGFDDMYRANDGASTPLNSGYNGTSADALAVAAGAAASSNSSCKGLQAPGGEGTYYAQAIYAAQQALANEQTSHPGSKNIMIILSDGNAQACNMNANTADGGQGGSGCSANQITALNCPTPGGTGCNVSGSPPSSPPLNGTGTSTTNPTWTTTNFTGWTGSYTGGYASPQYPSELGQCGQAVQAAQLATAAGTTVYTVAMGSPTSGGCLTDQTVTITGLSNGAWTWPTGSSYPKQPCDAIGAMASNVNTFFSDNVTASGSGSGCPASGGNVNYTTIAQIFTAIGSNLTSARLIP
jgi:Flp pilus assembly protein TadG